MSLTYVGIYVAVLSSILPRFGIEIGNDALTTFVSVALTLIGGIIAMIGRYRIGGVTAAGTRKDSFR